MTLDEARAFIDEVPWTPVREVVYENTPVHAAPDPHQYVILGWAEVPDWTFRRFCKTIKEKGYKGRYAPPYDPGKVMTNDYLQIDDWCYWWIYPRMLNRCRADQRQHEPIEEQPKLWKIDRETGEVLG